MTTTVAAGVKSRDVIIRGLRVVPVFASLTAEDLEAVAEHLIERRYEPGAVILGENESTEYMYVVFSGKVKATKYVDGREYIRAIHKKGDWFGEIALLDGKTLPATLVAMEESRIGLISKETFQKSCFHDVKGAQQVIMHLCSRLREAWLSLEILNCPNAELRVRKVLDRLAFLYGIHDSRGVIIPDRFKHRDIAGIACVSRETASRCLSALQKAGEITHDSDRRIILMRTFHTS